MRPGDFSPGNEDVKKKNTLTAASASMRPGDFSPGNRERDGGRRALSQRTGFNEAGGFLPRKPAERTRQDHVGVCASMRPGDFSPGNLRRRISCARSYRSASMRPGDFSPGNSLPVGRPRPTTCFNEAGGFLPRKPRRSCTRPSSYDSRASMRPGDFSPGNSTQSRLGSIEEAAGLQ